MDEKYNDSSDDMDALEGLLNDADFEIVEGVQASTLIDASFSQTSGGGKATIVQAGDGNPESCVPVAGKDDLIVNATGTWAPLYNEADSAEKRASGELLDVVARIGAKTYQRGWIVDGGSGEADPSNLKFAPYAPDCDIAAAEQICKLDQRIEESSEPESEVRDKCHSMLVAAAKSGFDAPAVKAYFTNRERRIFEKAKVVIGQGAIKSIKERLKKNTAGKKKARAKPTPKQTKLLTPRKKPQTAPAEAAPAAAAPAAAPAAAAPARRRRKRQRRRSADSLCESRAAAGLYMDNDHQRGGANPADC